MMRRTPMRLWSLCALAILGLAGMGPAAARAEEPAPNRIGWQPWGAATFRRAEAEGKALLLVVSTTWCHWCHVMQRETYADPRVEQALARGFVAVKVDADDRPDLAERFRKYRWPATAFFSPAGDPVLALRGYRSAEELLAILADVQRRVRTGGPYPGFDTPEAPRAPRVDPDRAFLEGLRARLIAQLDGTYDLKEQGWGAPQKYPLAEPVVWGLRRGLTHPEDKQALRRAMDTLAASAALLDPVFGGMFQYSVGPTWKEPHYEKIMSVNAGALLAFSRAFALSSSPRWLRDAQAVKRWFERFLSAESGTFFTSQDAEVNGREASAYHRLDEAGRLSLGIPRVDRHVYARENGQAIQAFVTYGRAAADAPALTRAQAAAERILATHLDPERGLFRHAEGDPPGRLYLLDQCEMGLALLALAQADARTRWHTTIRGLAAGLLRDFAGPDGGLYDVAEAAAGPGALGTRSLSLEGHAQAARFLLGASVMLEEPNWRRAALEALTAVADPAYLADHDRQVGSLLLAVEEALTPVTLVTLHTRWDQPVHLSLLAAVHAAQERNPGVSVRGVPLHSRELLDGAAFAVVCAPDGTCSEPLETPFALETALARR